MEGFDNIEKGEGAVLEKSASKRRLLQEPVQLDPDEVPQILTDIPAQSPVKRNWFGRLSSQSLGSPHAGGDHVDKDHMPQRSRGWLPFSKGPLQPYVAQNQDPFQPGSTCVPDIKSFLEIVK